MLVYQTSDSYGDLLPMLERITDQRCTVYGSKRNEDRGHVPLKDFSEDGFIEDLRSARAVIAGGGFSLMGEAV